MYDWTFLLAPHLIRKESRPIMSCDRYRCQAEIKLLDIHALYTKCLAMIDSNTAMARAFKNHNLDAATLLITSLCSCVAARGCNTVEPASRCRALHFSPRRLVTDPVWSVGSTLFNRSSRKSHHLVSYRRGLHRWLALYSLFWNWLVEFRAAILL